MDNPETSVMRRASTVSILAHGLVALVEPNEAARSRVRELVQEVDEMVVELRQAIFRLGLPSDPTEPAWGDRDQRR